MTPLSERLRRCAALVPDGATVADVGTDHGYLSIALAPRCTKIFASDLRRKPLERARENIRRCGLEDKIELLLSDGLQGYLPGSFDTLICAGMGGDCISGILQAAPWLRDERYTLILQPQSSGNDLRRYLGEQGFAIRDELLASDGGFLYQILRVQYGGGQPLSPGEQYVSPALLHSGDPLLGAYLCRIEAALQNTVAGLRQAQGGGHASKTAYYTAALAEVSNWRAAYEHHHGK